MGRSVKKSLVRTVMEIVLKKVLPISLVALVIKALVEKPFLRKALLQTFYLLLEKWTDGAQARKEGFVLSGKDITKEWLQSLLRERYPGVEIGSVKSKVMGDDMGNASLMFRLQIEYAGENQHDLPQTMILKTPKNKAKARIPFAATRMLEMEARFFSDVEPSLERVREIHVPKAFASKFNDRGNMLVLMEDLSLTEAEFRTEENVLKTLAEAKQAVRGIASFHSPFWDSPRLDEHGDLSCVIQQSDPILGMTKEFMEAGWQQCVARMGSNMPRDVRERGRDLIPIAQRLHDYAAGGRGGAPQTIVHGDCHLENSYIVPSDKVAVGWELGLYDMQIMRRGNGAVDLASFLAGSLEPGLYDANEDEILQTYLNRLGELRGDEGLICRETNAAYSLTQLKRDFRLCLGLLFCWNVAATLAVPFDSVAQHDYDLYMGRLCRTMDRLKVIDHCLASLGGKTLHTNQYRGGSLSSWEVPPVEYYVPNKDLPHEKYDYQTHRAIYQKVSPGIWNYLKYKMKYRFMLTKTSSRSGHHGQKTSHLSPEFLEGHHPVEWAQNTPVENAAFDSYYLSSFAPFEEGNNPSFALRWCKRARDDHGENWLVIKIPNDAIYTWLDHPNTQCDVTYEGENTIVVSSPDGTTVMRLQCVKAMDEWRVEFNGQLRNTKTGKLHKASFDLTWQKKMHMFSFGTDVSPKLTAEALALETFTREWGEELKAAHQEHYELFGETVGKFSLDGQTPIHVRGRGMRDRAFGMRDWGYMQRYISQYFWVGSLEKSRYFNVTMASLPTLSHAKFGFVHHGNGENEKAVPFDSMSGNFEKIGHNGIPAKELWLSFVANDITYTMKMFVAEGDTIPLNMGPNGMLVNLRFARYEVSHVDPQTGKIVIEHGYGASEFGYRYEGVVPAKPSLENLKYLPVTGEELQ